MRVYAIALFVLLLPMQARALGLCSVTSVTAMDYGTYDVFASTPKTSTASLMIGCLSLSSTDRVTVTLSKGSSGTYNHRAMAFGTSTVQYNVYLDSGYTTIFGDGTGGTSTVGPVGPSGLLGGALTINMYGRIFARQNVPAGVYLDTVIVTVSF